MGSKTTCGRAERGWKLGLQTAVRAFVTPDRVWSKACAALGLNCHAGLTPGCFHYWPIPWGTDTRMRKKTRANKVNIDQEQINLPL